MRENGFVGKPIRSLQVMLRALASADDDLETIVPDGIYGEQTRKAVMSFQRKHGIPASGITDLDTWEAIVQEHKAHRVVNGPADALRLHLQPGQVIIPGEENRHMYAINGILQALSMQYESMPLAEGGGVHTDSGVEAVMWLQEKAGMECTGHIDRHTWRMIAGLYRATMGDGT